MIRMGQITRMGKRISQLIIELENIKKGYGDLFCYSDRFGSLIDASFDLSFVREPKNKRQIRKFWSEYYPEEDKGERCVRVW